MTGFEYIAKLIEKARDNGFDPIVFQWHNSNSFNLRNDSVSLTFRTAQEASKYALNFMILEYDFSNKVAISAYNLDKMFGSEKHTNSFIGDLRKLDFFYPYNIPARTLPTLPNTDEDDHKLQASFERNRMASEIRKRKNLNRTENLPRSKSFDYSSELLSSTQESTSNFDYKEFSLEEPKSKYRQNPIDFFTNLQEKGHNPKYYGWERDDETDDLLINLEFRTYTEARDFSNFASLRYTGSKSIIISEQNIDKLCNKGKFYNFGNTLFNVLHSKNVPEGTLVPVIYLPKDEKNLTKRMAHAYCDYFFSKDENIQMGGTEVQISNKWGCSKHTTFSMYVSYLIKDNFSKAFSVLTALKEGDPKAIKAAMSEHNNLFFKAHSFFSSTPLSTNGSQIYEQLSELKLIL